MTLENLVTFDSIPDYVLDNMWFVEIIDDKLNNKVLFDDINGKFDSYVSDVNIPQESLKFEKTSFGVPMFGDQEEYESVSLTFYDDSTKCTMSKFFQDWLDSIYDRYKRRLKSDWRKQSKNINVYLVKIHNLYRGYDKSSTISNITSQNDILSNNKILERTEYNVFASYELENCFPTALEPISLSEDGGDRLKFNLKLECERMNPLYGNNINNIMVNK